MMRRLSLLFFRQELIKQNVKFFGRAAGSNKLNFKQKQELLKQQLEKEQNELNDKEEQESFSDEEDEIEFQNKNQKESFKQMQENKQKNKLKFLNKFNDQNIKYDSESSSDFDEEFAEKVKSHPFALNHQKEGQSQEIVVNYDDELDNKADKETIKFVQETLMYTGEDSMPNKLVNRPMKGVVWGLGGELLKQQENFFRRDRAPVLEEIIQFLELEQCKDISVTNLHEYDKYDLPQWGIVCTTFSCRHNTRVAKSLQKQVNSLELDKEFLKNKASVSGRKDDEWVMVQIGEIMVHLFNEDMRYDFDIESKWKDTDDDTAALHEKLIRTKKGKSMFEPFENLM